MNGGPTRPTILGSAPVPREVRPLRHPVHLVVDRPYAREVVLHIEPPASGYGTALTRPYGLNDIGVHRKNPWAWTPYAKLCETSPTPWLFLDEPPRTVTGRVTIERDGTPAWEGDFSCGGDSLYHRIEDMTAHILSYPILRRPGLVNYLLLGADKATYHDGFRIEDGDRMVIDVTSHGVVLANPVQYGQAATADSRRTASR
ncbi:hypothetical protein ACFY1U_47865 [Streptomyces sp. NPDC001351]|uniref:hypothetical protein n=1 Tax=Streptomyces sp. NPDC001351 TaxID=3364564 RepID=UPI0036882610